MQFWVRIAILFTLHELVRISESSHVSIFKLFSVLTLCEHEFGSGLGLLLPGSDHAIGSDRSNTQSNTYVNIKHAYTPTRATIYSCIHKYTHTCIHTYTSKHLHINSHRHIFTHAHIHAYIHTQKREREREREINSHM